MKTAFCRGKAGGQFYPLAHFITPQTHVLVTKLRSRVFDCLSCPTSSKVLLVHSVGSSLQRSVGFDCWGSINGEVFAGFAVVRKVRLSEG